MTAINPTLPNDGDPGWGDTLNAALHQIINQINAQDTQLAAVGAGTAPPAATGTSLGVVELAGDLTGTATAPSLKTIVAAGSVGSASLIPVITYDAKGRITSASTVTAASSSTTTTSGVTITDNGNGTFTLVGPAPGTSGNTSLSNNGNGTFTLIITA